MKNDATTGSMARQRSAGTSGGNDANRNHSNNAGGLSSASTGNMGSSQGSQGSQQGQRSKPGVRAGSGKYYDIASTILGKSGDVETVFFNAAKNGNVAKLEQILSQRGHVNLEIDCRDKRTGNTALMWAAKRGHSKVVELLLNHGADPTLCNYEAQTAIELGFSPAKTLLLDWVEAEHDVTSRLLLQAAWQGNMAMVFKILANGGAKYINCQNSDGLTPLMLVSRDIQLFERLSAQLNRYYSPVEVAQELIKAGANIHVTDNDGRSSLHYASQSRAGMAERLVNTLMGGGLDPELRDKRLFTPIHLASQLGNTQNVVALIDGGSEVNVRGFGGLTPLHMTAYNDHQKTAVTLLNRGADVCIVDDRGLTAVDLAKTRKMKVMLKEAWMDATTTNTKTDNESDNADINRNNNNDNKSKTKLQTATNDSNETKKKKSAAPAKKRPEVIFDNLKSSINNGVATANNKNQGLSNVEKCKQREKKILEDVEALKAAHPVLQRETTRMLGTTRTKILPQIGRSSSPEHSQQQVCFAPTPDEGSSSSVSFSRGDESRWSLEDTRLQLLSRGRSVSDIKLGIGRQSRMSTLPPQEAEVFILDDLKSSISSPSPAFDRKGYQYPMPGGDSVPTNMADIAASCEPFLPNTKGKRGTPKPLPIHSNGSSKQSSPAFFKQQSFTFPNRGDGKEQEMSPRQNDKFIQACNSPMELLRSRSLLKEDFVLEESRPKEASSGSDPASSASSLSSSSPRDSAIFLPPHSVSPSKTLRLDPSLSTLVEHTGSHSGKNSVNKAFDVLNDENVSTVNHEFASKPVIRDPKTRRRRNSENSASADFCSSSSEFSKPNFSPRFQKDRGLVRAGSQRNTPTITNGSTLSPRLMSTLHKSQSFESLSPRRSHSPVAIDNKQQSNNPRSSAMKTKDATGAERKLSFPESTTQYKDRSIPDPLTSKKGNVSGNNQSTPLPDKKSPPAKRPIAPFSGKVRLVSNNALDNWDSLNQEEDENLRDNLEKQTTGDKCLFTPVRSADGPKKSLANSLEENKRNLQVSKSCSEQIQTTNSTKQIARPHTSSNQITQASSPNSPKTDLKDAIDITSKLKQGVSLKNQSITSKSSDAGSVRKSAQSSAKNTVRRGNSNPSSSQEISNRLAAKLLAVRSPSVTLSKQTDVPALTPSYPDDSVPANNLFVVSDDSVRKGSASKERLKERIASAKRQKNETSQEPDSKKVEDHAEVSTKDKLISKVAAKIEQSLKKNDAQIALQRKCVNSMQHITKEDPSRLSNITPNSALANTSTKTSTVGTNKNLNQPNNSKTSNVPSSETNTSTKKDGKSLISSSTASNVKASSSSLASSSSTSLATKADKNSASKQKQVTSTSVSASTKQYPITSKKSEKEKSTEEPKQARAIDPNVILTPRSTEPLVKIKLKSKSDAPVDDTTSATYKSNTTITATPLIVNPYEEFSYNTSSSNLLQTTKDAIVKLKKTPKTVSNSSKLSKKTSTSSKRPQSGSSRVGVVTNKKRVGKSKESQKEGRPKSNKKSSKKKESQEAVDLHLEVESESSDQAIISGIGWRLSTNCIDTSNVHPAKDISVVTSDQLLYREIVNDESDKHLTREFEQIIGEENDESDNLRSHLGMDQQTLEVFKEKITLNSPRFLEMKRRQESQIDIQLPVLTNDGFPPMNLDVMQASSSEMKNEEMNFYEFGLHQNATAPLAQSNEAIQRGIFIDKLTPIPEASFVSKTINAISNFDKSVKDERLSQLLEDITPREEVKSSGRKEIKIPKHKNQIITTPNPESKIDSFSYEYTYTSSGKTIKKSQSFKEKSKEKPMKERRFSETKSFESNPNEDEEAIDEAIDEILSSTLSSTTSTLKCHDFKSNTISAGNTLTEHDQNVLKKLTSSAKDSPFHARSAEGTGRYTSSPLPPSPEDITKELNDLNKKLNSAGKSSSTSAGNSAKQIQSSINKSGSASGSTSLNTKPPLSNRSSMNLQHTPTTPRSKVALKRSTSMKETESKGQLSPRIDLKALEISEEETQQLARVMSSLRHMELHAGTPHHNNSNSPLQRDGFGGSAKALKSNKGDVSGGKIQGRLSLPASALVRPSSTGAAAKYKGKFHELKEDSHGGSGAAGGGSASAAGGGSASAAAAGGSGRRVLSNQVVASHEVRSSVHTGEKQASKDQLVLPLDDKLMESLQGDLDHAKDAEDIQNLYFRLTERRDSLCGSEFSMDSGKSVDDTIQWKKGNVLGKGAFGTVWCGLTSEGELIAVKQIALTTMNQAKAHHEYEKIQEEVELLKTLNHINIVGYLGTSLEDEIVSIFMQFIPGGSLASILARFGALEESVFQRYTKQILEGVDYLHSNDVIHRDLKGANIMLMPTGIIKLIDFGCAKRLCINLNLSQTEILKSMKGTPFWMAPEVVNETGHGKKSDIWSIGCTVFEMATRKPPWADMNPLAAIFAIGRANKPVPRLPEKFSQDAIDFVSACMTRDQDMRCSATDLLNHVFITRKSGRKASKAKEENISEC